MVEYLLNDAKFWTAVAFVVFILVIFKPMKNTLIKTIDDKILLIKNKIIDSEKQKKEAEILYNQTNNRYQNIKNEISKIEEETKIKIKKMKINMMSKLESSIQRHKELNKLKIKQIEQDTISFIKETTINMTIDSVKEIMENKLSSELKNSIISKSLKELKPSLKS